MPETGDAKDNSRNCKGFVYLISLKPLLSFIVNKFSLCFCAAFFLWDMFIIIILILRLLEFFALGLASERMRESERESSRRKDGRLI